jgi:hypothetical protein
MSRVGAILMYVVAGVVAALGVAMIVRTDFWVEFFRFGYTRAGRAVNRRLMTRSTVIFQGVIALIFSGVLVTVATVVLVAP